MPKTRGSDGAIICLSVNFYLGEGEKVSEHGGPRELLPKKLFWRGISRFSPTKKAQRNATVYWGVITRAPYNSVGFFFSSSPSPFLSVVEGEIAPLPPAIIALKEMSQVRGPVL